ncbi:MAG: hypothetical protein NVS2B8_07380 [Vulcanimicrobiaceae bacterium]
MTADAVPTPSASPAAPAASASPSTSPSPTPTKLFSATGFVDLAFEAANNTDRIRFTNGNLSRILDGGTNAYVDLNGGRQLASPSDFLNNLNVHGGVFNLAYNGTPIAVHLEGVVGSDAKFFASNGQSRQGTNLLQAFLQYATGPATLLLGKYESLAGAEVPETISNTNFSRDYLYAAVPTTVTGARLTYVATPKITLVGGVNNGWDDIKFAGKKKTFEAAIQLAPSPGYSLNLTTLNGGDFLAAGSTGVPPVYTNRMLYDAVLTIKPTSALNFVINYDRATQLGDAFGTPAQRWNGVAGYANYTFSPLFAGSLRKETFYDPDGARLAGPTAQRVQSNTATFSYTPNANYLVRAEYRLDTSDGNNFTYRNAALDPITGFTAGRPHQSTIAVEAVYKFP